MIFIGLYFTKKSIFSRLKRPAYEIEMHKIIQNANVINATAVENPCGDPNKLEDMGIINEGILSGIKVSN